MTGGFHPYAKLIAHVTLAYVADQSGSRFSKEGLCLTRSTPDPAACRPRTRSTPDPAARRPRTRSTPDPAACRPRTRSTPDPAARRHPVDVAVAPGSVSSERKSVNSTKDRDRVVGIAAEIDRRQASGLPRPSTTRSSASGFGHRASGIGHRAEYCSAESQGRTGAECAVLPCAIAACLGAHVIPPRSSNSNTATPDL
jgi:hypothetical protein